MTPKKVNTVGGVMGGKGFLKPKFKGTYNVFKMGRGIFKPQKIDYVL